MTETVVEQPAILDVSPREGIVAWSPMKRLLFRFAFVYLVLYNLPFPLNYIPYVDVVTIPYEKLWNGLVPWVGQHVFGIEITVHPSGSGDTLYDFVQLFCFLVVATIATIVWTLLDRRRTEYRRLHDGLRTYVRFALAAAMIGYGAAKVIPSQFPAPSASRLMQPFGDASPMGLLWTFMGASAAYTIFAGAMEMLAGLLLIARRTTLLGALVAIGVMTNVVLLNFCYDVPVKLYSTHLLAEAVFLCLPDVRRLADLLLFHRPVPADEIRPWFTRPAFHRTALILRNGGFALLVGWNLYSGYKSTQSYTSPQERSALYGVWDITDLEIDGQPRPPLLSDGERWRRVIFDYPQSMSVQLVSDSRQRFITTIDPKAHTLEINRRDDAEHKFLLSYAQPESSRLEISGTFEGKAWKMQLQRVDERPFLLRDRGFHWINEYPFNR